MLDEVVESGSARMTRGVANGHKFRARDSEFIGILRGALLEHDPVASQNHRIIQDFRRVVDMVRGHHDRPAGICLGEKMTVEHIGVVGIQADIGFVEKQKLGPDPR